MDEELNAMQAVMEALIDLDQSSKARVLIWVAGRLGIDVVQTQQIERNVGYLEADVPTSEIEVCAAKYSDFADLFYAIHPSGNADMALVAGYWLQEICGVEQFGAHAVNKELQQLGCSIANITAAFTQLMKKKPSLAIQMRKSGRSQQARKQYRLTHAGIDVVRNMLESGNDI